MSMDPMRDAANRDAMTVHGLDAVVCRLPENVLLLTGHWPLSGLAMAVVPRQGTTTLIALHTEAADIPASAADDVRSVTYGVVGAPDPYIAFGQHLTEVVRSAGLERARIGCETSIEAIAPGIGAAEVMVPSRETQAMIARAAPGATLVDAGPALNAARLHKTTAEVKRLRRANHIAAFGLDAFRAGFEPGRTEAEVAARVEAAIMSRGTGYDSAMHVRSWAQLMTGPASAHAYSPHPATSSRTIERGDLGVLELATVVDGYWSDLTRTLVAGRPPDVQQEELYGAILEAHRAVMKDARPGMRGADVDGLARDEVVGRGFGSLFVHQTGHGLGFRYHESAPMLNPANQDVVQAGMVTSVEPGLYIEGYGGMRLEENVVFTENGVELLSVFSRDLATDGSREQ